MRKFINQSVGYGDRSTGYGICGSIIRWVRKEKGKHGLDIKIVGGPNYSRLGVVYLLVGVSVVIVTIPS